VRRTHGSAHLNLNIDHEESMSATTLTADRADACTADHSTGAGSRFAIQRELTRLLIACTISTLAACGGSPAPAPVTTTPAVNLTVSDVQQILAQTIQEAQAHSKLATIAVVDRVGNVLAVYRMGSGTPNPVLVASTPDASGNPGIHGGLEGIRLPVPGLDALHLDDQAAIAKAVSGAYLSSAGQAFSTRTASQIIESHFNPGEAGQPAGPLFGVQFSSLACSDFTAKFNGTAPAAGPHRTPLGLSADPGGFPLYKSGAVAGGVGVIADGLYSIDNSTSPDQVDLDEAIAYAGTYGFGAPDTIHADRITVGGRTLRFSNINDYGALAANPAHAPAFTSLPASTGALVATSGYSTAAIQAGTTYADAASGVRSDAGAVFPGQDAFVFVDDTNSPRYAPRAGTDGSNALTAAEVTQVLRSAFAVASKTRAQIRIPPGDTARVTIAITDTHGVILGMVASRDAAVFGADVSIQKARSAALLSSAAAAAYLTALPPARYLTTDAAGVHIQSQDIGAHVTVFQSFMGNPVALADGATAYSARAIGNLSRPFFPDGIDGTAPGPLATLGGSWSPFHTGLQLDLSINAILQHVLYVAGASVPDVVPGCSAVSLATDLSAVSRTSTDVVAGNGLQIFAGGVPIYRGNTLVGAIGVSGDGTQQDDLIAFRGLADGGSALAGVIGNAPPSMRADTLAPQGIHVLYVQCPAAPFVNSDVQDACDGL
jgi:uncharacterized protein GlcG (DUF336 family)